ncbi:MAG: SIS domain-containing protein, partial [Candidatus Kapabacteria bacterium]|nr:SIS domain-containing protein [Candidatus Kapabacteria bacterium]
MNIIHESITESIETKRRLLDECSADIQACADMIIDAYRRSGKLLLAGNGGSAADAQHIAAELVVRFRGSVERRALPAIALSVDPSMMSAGGNDYGFEETYARLVEAYALPTDVLIAITTSGTSKNIIHAVSEAKRKGIRVIGLLGCGGGTLAPLCDA